MTNTPSLDHRDIVDIQQLLALYGHAVDAPDQSLLPLVFTEDAVFEGGGSFEGLPAICDFFALGKPPHPPSHQTTNIWVREENGTVTVKSKWFVIQAEDGSLWTGDYDDLVVRTPEGWRIKRRVVSFRHPPGGL